MRSNKEEQEMVYMTQERRGKWRKYPLAEQKGMEERMLFHRNEKSMRTVKC
jgi:hypothetical protein